MRPKLSLNRKTNTRKPIRKFFVFTEGKNTEPEYLQALGRLYRDADVKIIDLGAAGVPFTLARKAIDFLNGTGLKKSKGRSLDSFEKNDQVWAMFDRDTHPKVPEAIDACKRNGVHLAYSNPCFELWLILHFEDFNKSDGHTAVQKHFEKVCDAYSTKSGKTSDCESYIGKLSEAEARAEKLVQKRREEDAEYNAPWTSVHKLTEAVRIAATESARK